MNNELLKIGGEVTNNKIFSNLSLETDKNWNNNIYTNCTSNITNIPNQKKPVKNCLTPNHKNIKN